MTGLVQTLDDRVLHVLYALRTMPGTYAGIWVSELGEFWTITGITCIVIILLLRARRYAGAAVVTVTMMLTGLTVLYIKEAIMRPRPPAFFQAFPVSDYSFPSGHATGAIVIYGLCAYLLALACPRVRRMIYAVASIIIIAIGFSRLWLGVHYLSDVLAGYALGALILCAAVWTLRRVGDA